MLLLCGIVHAILSYVLLKKQVFRALQWEVTVLWGQWFILSIHLGKIVVNDYVNRSIPQNTAHTYNCIHLRGTYNNWWISFIVEKETTIQRFSHS